MREVLGHGALIVEVEEHVERDLARVEQKVAKTMRKIDRERASLTLDAKIEPLERKVDEARAKIKHYKAEAEKAASLGLSTKNAERRLREWEAKLNQRREARDSVKLDTSEARQQLKKLQNLERQEHNAALELADARQEAYERVESARTEAAERAARDRRAIAQREVAEAKRREEELAAAAARADEARRKSRKRTGGKEAADEAEALINLLTGESEQWEENAEAVAEATRAKQEHSRALDEYQAARARANAVEEETNLILGRRPKYDAKTEMVNVRELQRMAEFDRSAFDDPTQRGRTRAEYERLKADIERHGITSPIRLEVDRVGNTFIGEGNHRLAIAQELGIQEVPVKVVVTDRESAGKSVRMNAPDAKWGTELAPSDIGIEARKVALDDYADHAVATEKYIAARQREIELSAAREAAEIAEAAAREEREAQEREGQKYSDFIEAQARKERETQEREGQRYADYLDAQIRKSAESYEQMWDRAHAMNAAFDKRRAREYEQMWDRAHAMNAEFDRRAQQKMDALHEQAIRMDMARDARLQVEKWKNMRDLAIAQDRAAAMNEKFDYERATANERHAQSMANLNREYLNAMKTLRKLRNTKTPFVRENREQLELDTQLAEAKLARVAAEIKALGGIEPEIKINVERGFQNRAMNSVRKGLDAFQNLGNVAVRVGPFTSSLRGLMQAMILLGPIIVSLVGSLSALVGVTGAGLVGAMTVAGGAVTGFGLAAAGMFMAIKPVVGEITNAMKASQAYDKAVREYGKGSEQAAKKLAIFNNVMKNQSAEAKTNFLAAGRMKQAWMDATAPARRTAFDVMGKGIRFASDNMKWFAARTNTATKAVGDGLVKWMERLNSGGGRNVLKGIFDSFNQSIPHIMNALGNLGAYLGKVFNVGAREGTRLSGVFESWTDRLNKGFDGSKVLRMIGYAKDLGRFLTAAGRALTAFFGAGASEGANFLQDMTRGLNDWTASMTGSGAGRLQDFFRESRENTQALWNALKPIGGQFITWASNLAPFVTMLLQGAGILTRFGAGILRIIEGVSNLVPGVGTLNRLLFGTENVASTLVATFGLMWAVGRAGAFFAVVGRGVAILRSLAAVAVVARAAVAATFAMGSLSAGIATASAGMAALRTGATASGAAAATAGGRFAALGAAGAGFGPVGLAVAAAATGAALGLNHLASNSDKWIDRASASIDAARGNEEAFNSLKDSIRGTSDSLSQAYFGASDAATNLRASQKGVRDAQAEVNKLRDAGKKGTDDYREAVARLRDEEARLARARYDDFAAEERIRTDRATLIKQQNDLIKTARTESMEASKAMRDMQNYEVGGWADRATGNDSQFKNLLQDMHDIQRGGKDAEEAMGRLYLRGGEVRDALKDSVKPGMAIKQQMELLAQSGGRAGAAARKYLEALNQQQEAQRRITDAENQKVLGELNAARAARGFFAISQKAAASFGQIERSAGKLGRTITTKIATKYDDPNKAAAVGKQAAAALKRGAKASVVLKIIANTRNADAAIEKLKRAKIPTKLLDIVEHGGKKAVAAVEAINGKKLNKKDAQIVEKGGAAALKMIGRVDGKKVKNKPFTIDAKDRATGILGGIINLLGRIQNKSVTVTTHFKETRSSISGKAAGGVVGGYASGGEVVQTSMQRQQIRASQKAQRKAALTTKGGRYRTPTMLVGEENRTEYVIATNPAYRDRNKRYLKAAANDLGLNVIDAAATGRAGVGTYGPGGTGYTANLTVPNYSASGSTYKFNARKKRKSVIRKARKHGGKKRLAPRNPWDAHVKGLLSQQSDLEREASIREAAVREPEDFVTETKNPDGTTSYSVDQGAVDQYREDVSKVREVYDSLVKVSQEIVQSIPKALDALRAERQAHKTNIATLEREIDREEKRLRTKGDTEKAKATRESARERLQKLRPALTRENRDLGATNNSIQEFSEEVRKEAGFDYREFVAEYNTLDQEIANLQGKAQGQVDAAIADAADGGGGTGGGGTGSGDTPLSYGAQAMIADTERANLLRDFGGNAYTTSPGSPGGPGPGGGGLQTNPASLSDPASGGSYMSGGYAAGLAALSGSTVGSGQRAATMLSGAYSGGGAAIIGGGDTTTTKTVNITNNYQTQPEDPHLWSQGMAFEAEGAF